LWNDTERGHVVEVAALQLRLDGLPDAVGVGARRNGDVLFIVAPLLPDAGMFAGGKSSSAPGDVDFGIFGDIEGSMPLRDNCTLLSRACKLCWVVSFSEPNNLPTDELLAQSVKPCHSSFRSLIASEIGI